MPVGLIRYRDERDQHPAVSRRDVSRRLALVVGEMFAGVFNAGKHPDDATLTSFNQEWDIAASDAGAFNVDDLTIVVTMDPGPDGRHQARCEELRYELAAKLLGFIGREPLEVRRHIKTIQVDMRFQPKCGLVVGVKDHVVVTAWGGSADAEIKGTTISPSAS